MRKTIAFILAAPLFAAAAIAADITGRVVDSSSEPLPGASVRLLENDSVTRALAVADVDGRFSIPSIKPGNYSLSLTMTGMDTVTRTLAVPATDTILSIKRHNPHRNLHHSERGRCHGCESRSRGQTRHTLEFNAGSYATKQNATVEDLLKETAWSPGWGVTVR